MTQQYADMTYRYSDDREATFRVKLMPDSAGRHCPQCHGYAYNHACTTGVERTPCPNCPDYKEETK